MSAEQSKSMNSDHALAQLNQFVRGDNGVWHSASLTREDFGYSDGQKTEQRLRWIFGNVDDLSCLSYELQQHIVDWPTEYHLTPKRANLLRGLDLSGVEKVLELGCGCGSISRYLGELGLQVDSVEGSPVRAELAAMRCRDLDNVRIATANFNEVQFPQDYYDLVLYVGVTEYAGRFSDGKTDQQALQDLLALADGAITNDGIVVIAIENRTGMKYVLGANEDHYSKPYIGIHDYAQPAGIRTYTRSEWLEQLSAAGFAACEFAYPFPDYKIPTVLLGDDYLKDNPYAYSHLESLRSRDYAADFDAGSHEALFWEAAAASGTLGEYANSFLLVTGHNAESVSRTLPYDFVHLPGYQRKTDYCLAIAKPKGQETVKRQLLAKPTDEQTALAKDAGITHRVIDNETFYRGPLLSVEWARSLISYPDSALFEQFLREYFEFLQGLSAAERTIDLLPSNIVLVNGQYQVIDEEWQLEQELSGELVFFRAVLFFYFTYRDFIGEKLAKAKELTTLQDWLVYSFAVIQRPQHAEQLLALHQQNQQFQNIISWQPGSVNLTEQIVATPAIASLLWRSDDEDFSDDKRVLLRGDSRSGRQQLRFELPTEVDRLDTLLLYPCSDYQIEQSAFFRIYQIRLSAIGADSQQRIIWQQEGEQAVADAASYIDMMYESGAVGSGFYVTAETPRIEWRVTDELAVQPGERLVVELDMGYLRSEQYLQMKDKYLSKLAHFEYQERLMRAQVEELQLIKRSRAWALAQRLTGLAQTARQSKSLLRKLLSGKASGKKKRPLSLSPESVDITPVAVRKMHPAPLISIVIPFRDQAALLRTCVESILEKTSYPNYEIIGISNDSCTPSVYQTMQNLAGSNVRFIEHNSRFNFSELANAGVAEAVGEYVALLNNDIEVTATDWLQHLLAYAANPKVGAVGGRLVFPDGRLQHAGIHIDESGLPVHSDKNSSVPAVSKQLTNDNGSTPRPAQVVTAVTGAMLMVRKELYLAQQGLDETDFAVAFNDVDFCLRLQQQGLHTICSQAVLATHHESISRGYETTVDKAERFLLEQQRFLQRYPIGQGGSV